MSVQDEKPAVTIDSFDLGELTGPPVAVPVRIARIAARWPGRPALRSGDRVLTYGRLDELTADLAGRLAAAGVRPGDVVAVRGTDRFDQVTGLLAVWRAGAVHLALDPAAPTGRNERLTALAGAHLILDGGDLLATERADGPPDPAAPVSRGEDAATSDRIGGLPDPAAPANRGDGAATSDRTGGPPDPAAPTHRRAAPDLPVTGDRLAYLIHTSGTTGEPKAVAVAHGPLAAHVEAISARFGLRADDVVLHFARSTVDVAVEQITTALTAGACLVVPEAKLLSADEFWQLLDAERVTVANVAAGYFHDLVAAMKSVPKTLRTMISGSDRLSPAAAAAWTERTGVRLLNAYGPTETVITSTVHEVRPGRAITVGTPVGDRVAHLLDDRLQPVDEGELYLGGSLLATGYLGDGGRTAERFLPDPVTGGRMYRTGDRARRTADGELEFLGRADDQVKIRGFRVEPGEVENALARHPAVTACAVVPRESANGTQLAAYVVTHSTLGYPELRDFLAQSLPDHLIPASLTPLDHLPLTAAGKVDRAALPEPARAETGHRAPRTPDEQLLAAIWADVLGVPRVGLDDNFFHLGGDSLTAVRVAGRVLEVFGPVSPYQIFDAPTLAAFAAAMHDGVGDDRPGPVRAPASEAPLSRFQRGLWLLDAWQPGTSTYNVPWVFDFTGPLDADALHKALQQVVDRHEALRTTFDVAGTLPRQVIHPHLEVPFTITDASDAAAFIAADARIPFDLETGPLLRARLVRTSATTASLVLVFHHIVWDEGSLGVLDRELREYYTALLDDRAPRLPDLAIQYADYANWLRDNGIAESQLDYWAEHLRGVPDRPALVPDHPRPVEPAQRCGYHRFAFDADLANAVREFAKDADATPFMVLLAGLVLAVHRTGGADDLVVGTPVSVRERPELDALIGYFITLVPLRFRIEQDVTLREVLEHVRGVALDGYRHQDVPLEDITGRVLGERSGDRNPLFQLVFEMHTADPSPEPFGPAAVERRLHVNELSRFDLSWSVEDDGTGFTGRIEYDTDLFDAATLAALGAQWRTAVADLVTDPDVPLHEDVTPAGLDVPVHELFEHQVTRTPDAVALISGDAELTYTELNARANRVARHLRTHGVTEGDVVAVLIDRDADLVVALLGVLKAGGGYTLLDPELPEARRADAVDAVDARLVVDREFVAAADGPDDDLGLPVSADAVACVMFTSGSTGRPKGVAASHRALAGTYLEQDYALFAPGEVWLQCSPVSWDAFGLEVYGPLLFGGTCVLHPGQRPDPETMTALVARHGVTQLQLSASLFNFLVDEFPAIFAGLRVVFTGGERASVPHVARLAERYPHVRIVNGYGPVESMGFTTCHVVGPADLAAPALPIGVPVAHKDIRVLDDHFRPSAAGELYATGAGLALGYAGQPGLTADRFLPDPLGPPGSRMYRTGDVGGRTPDGTLTITGRADDQVKIRGFRVEPGEVAAALAHHPGVKDSAVVAHDDRLAAYVVARDTPPGYQDVCDHLATLLPDYMIPESVTVLDALPLTANGKLDRAALPAPASVAAEAPAEPAVTAAEQLVAAVWAEVLGLDAVGVDDSFFRLGGNSLAAVRVALRLSTETGTRVAPRLVFAARTVRALAQRLEVRA
ncbi:non-ribosomal peptide synthetase [Amycolatopsis sp. NBC_01286]|uniref:non-ribosomal peptide synthetase n=1 Tax=Amycolatopsis sp. NBC_01286 TaxID=2903560 RepID=UPI002E105CCE|nr:non-ribosomal peptide synthetase [Amycolatopsis sp. NBC_01286]WSK77946.1 amino acid adenylation domain-containing protein [Amycolatopsis sp. NBC_01286]